jgi:hypothetical protein
MGEGYTNTNFKSNTEFLQYNERQISEPINTNKGARHGCGLAPDLFNIYIDIAMREHGLCS